ncbi:XrtA/PEP-CTERM system-associated ATPase [Salidesulfovibrio brasiliensis]|uniref:XrtA/PEP-CTERM system-associated ATPase n=1 Tax=Salidesulfovibrio brasiliensis TaxID=221711 RepID=UPI0006D0CA0C|nr:XrtA/PEP-CTERM system-associated ATPase [Salidesulfovibrio brasiliensis]
MYESFFNLNTKPFDLLPNPSYLYMSGTHGKALSYLRYGIQERIGFILLTGEVGAGKTTLIQELIKSHLERVTLARVFNTRVDSQQLLTMINDDFGLETGGRSKAALVRELNDFLIDQYAMGNQAVLIIDEAQNLSGELLEEVRMLSNLETDGGKLVQIVLVGQPELRDTLAKPELLQMRQRIQVACHLGSLDESEVKEYVLCRLEKAGNREAVAIEDGAFGVIHGACRGIPRLINILCDYMMMDAFSDERKTVAQADVQAIVDELDFERKYWNPKVAAKPVRKTDTTKPALAYRSRKAEEVLRAIRNLDARLESAERQLGISGPEAMLNLSDRVDRIEQGLAARVSRLEEDVNMARQLAMDAGMYLRRGPERPLTDRPGQEPKRGWVSRMLFGDR